MNNSKKQNRPKEKISGRLDTNCGSSKRTATAYKFSSENAYLLCNCNVYGPECVTKEMVLIKFSIYLKNIF